jgi:hypothetical protein
MHGAFLMVPSDNAAVNQPIASSAGQVNASVHVEHMRFGGDDETRTRGPRRDSLVPG